MIHDLPRALEQARLAHAKLAHFYGLVLAHRLSALLVLAAARGILDGLTPFATGDFSLFSEAGRALITGRFADVWANPDVQTGPLHLLLFGLNDILSGWLGYPLEMGITVAVSVGLTAAALITFRVVCRSIGRHPTPGFEFYFGVMMILGGFTFEAATSAHPGEGFIPLLWILVGLSARSQRPVRAGLLLGIAAAVKPWGALGVPLLLVDPVIRHSLIGMATGVGVTAAAYVPVALGGSSSGLVGYRWTVHPQSPLILFVEPDSPFTWTMRLAQALFVVTAGALVSIIGRRSPRVVWLCPLALAALRYLSDPLDYHYYWLTAGLIALIGFSSLITFEPTWLRLPLAAGFYVTLAPFYMLSGTPWAVWIAAASIALLVFVAVNLHKERSRIPSPVA